MGGVETCGLLIEKLSATMLALGRPSLSGGKRYCSSCHNLISDGVTQLNSYFGAMILHLDPGLSKFGSGFSDYKEVNPQL